MARVRYLDKQELPKEFRHLFDRAKVAGQTGHLFRLLAYSPLGLRQVMRMGNAFAALSLDPRLRELALLTVGRLTGAVYEYTHHIEVARNVGVTEEQIVALPIWQRHPAFSERERAVIRYAEAVTRDVQVADATFAAVQAELGDQQVIELTLIVSYYNFIARFLEALQAELETPVGEGHDGDERDLRANPYQS